MRLQFDRTTVARNSGLSEHQQNQAIRVARVPQEQFDRQVEFDNPATTTALAAQGAPRTRALKPVSGPYPSIDDLRLLMQNAEDIEPADWMGVMCEAARAKANQILTCANPEQDDI